MNNMTDHNRHKESQKLTAPPFAPDVVMRDIQFLLGGLTNPLDNSPLSSSDLLVTSLTWLIIFRSRAAKAASPLIRTVFSTLSCRVKGSVIQNSLRYHPCMYERVKLE